jgi:phosphatidylserine synthase
MEMNTKTDNQKSRNVTAKDLIQAAFVVVALVILAWYKETGSKAAALVFTALPLVALLYYLRIPVEERKRTEQRVKAEMRQTMIGRLWIGFMYLLILTAVGLLLHSFVLK